MNSRSFGVLAAIFGFALSLGFISSPCAAADTQGTKSQIIKEVSGRNWVRHRYPYTGYETGRFHFEGSFHLPEGHGEAGSKLLGLVENGSFDVVPATQKGDDLEDLPDYVKDKPACASSPIKYWNGLSEMSVAQIERFKSKQSLKNLTPYLPGSSRPIDYETQLGGDLQALAAAASNFEFYDLDGGFRVFHAEDYVPIASQSASLHRLEGSFAVYNMPSCRFIGTLDYHNHCFVRRGNPIYQRDPLSVAGIINLEGRPFAITVSHARCDTGKAPSSRTLFLWDITAQSPVPLIYGFTEVEAQ
jgi:hypothetical protein